MNNLRPADLQDHGRARVASTRIGRKIAVGSLTVVVLLVMTVWLGFLGWGTLEILRGIWTWITKLWAWVA